MKARYPHIILTLGRSGSNTLVDLLNQNAEILNYGEVLGPWNQIRRLRYLISGGSGREERYVDSLLRSATVAGAANLTRTARKIRHRAFDDIKRLREVRTVGFKEFLLNILKMGLAEHLLSQPDIRFIGLTRSNPLERLVSTLRLGETREVLSRESGGARSVSLTIDAPGLVPQLDIMQREVDDLEDLLAQVPSERKYVLDYSEFYSNPEVTIGHMRNIYDFLGVTPSTPRVRMTKITQRPMAEVISNYDECRRATAGTRFERYFA